MTQDQFQDALGMIDDDLIEAVDHLRQQRDSSHILSSDDPLQSSRKRESSHKSLRRKIIRWGSLAAGICLLIGVRFLWFVGGKTTAESAPGLDHYYSKQDNAEAVIEDSKNGSSENISDTSLEIFPETSLPAVSSPPELFVLTAEGTSIQALSGTYSWRWADENGQLHVIKADALHPLESQEFLSLVETAGSSIQLQFDTSTHGVPYHISAQCWSDSYWDHIGVAGQPLTVYDDQIPLQEGGTIYEITAKWNSGVVHYAIYVKYIPE